MVSMTFELRAEPRRIRHAVLMALWATLPIAGVVVVAVRR